MQDVKCIQSACPLFGNRQVHGCGPIPSFGMLVGEAPGEREEDDGIPFVGRSGDELTRYMERAGLNRDMWRVENVLGCRPPKNADPTEAMLICCRERLINAIKSCNPYVIGAIGGFATRFFLGHVSLEYVHGIPYEIEALPDGTPIPKVIVIPCYHPALGLRTTEMMSHTQIDFYNLSATLQHKMTTRRIDQYLQREVDYKLIDSPIDIEYANRVAIDTEWAKGRPWCITWSTKPNTARMVMADDTRMLKFLRKWWDDPRVECDIHNALYDIPVLWQLGIHPKRVVDTMVMAYLLQTEPKGLKPLTYRYLNIKMQEYLKVVAPANQAKALAYLNQAYLHTWPDLEQVERWVAGKLKPKQPSNMSRRILNIMKDVWKSHEFGRPEEVDVYKRWHGIDEDEGRAMVEEALGKMMPADLSDIDFDTARHYACQDADVLYQLKPILWERIEALQLEDVFWTDMGMVPMISDMMVRGAKIDPDHFRHFSEDLQARMKVINNKIDEMAGKHINPESWIQVLNILLERKTFKYPQSTDAKHLKKFEHADPLVALILDHRGLQKLDGTYAKPMPRLADANNRVHTTIRTTHVATGRISSADPNLTNQPTKSADGKKIRAGFIAEYGNLIMAADYSQIELRILAHVSQDWNMLNCYANNLDLHAHTAKLIYTLGGHTEADWDALTKEERSDRRRRAKCFHPDTEVLTRRGWKRIVNLLYGEEVAQAVPVNKQGIKLEWVKPLYIGTMLNRWGFLYHLKNEGIDLRVTPDHTMVGQWCSGNYGDVLPEKFNGVRYFPNAGIMDSGNNDVDEVLLRLAVATQADGSIYRGSRGVSIKFGFSKGRKIVRLEHLLQDIPYAKALHHNGKNGMVTAFTLNGDYAQKVYSLLNDDKTFPYWWIDLSYHLRQIILDELQYWDSAGLTMQKWRMYKYGSTIRHNVNIIQAISSITNHKSRLVSTMDRVKYPSTGELVNLTVRSNCRSRGENINIERVNYSGSVAVITVPSNYILVRDGGVPVITKQCVNFGIAYGLSAYGLLNDLISQGVDITLEECQAFIDAWFNAYPGVFYWLDKTKAEAKRTGMVRDLFGRIRLCPEGYAADEWIRKAGERQAINTPIQSGAQGVVKRAMVALTPFYRAFNENKHGHVWWPLIQIHDDIRSEVTETMIDVVASLKTSVMENVVKLDIPTPVEIKVGPNWRDMHVLEL